MSVMLLFAISGLRVHLHHCGTTDKLYVDLHLNSEAGQHNSCACEHATPDCCSNTAGDDHASDHDNCTDLIEEITTDNNYQLSSFSSKFIVAELDLFNFQIITPTAFQSDEIPMENEYYLPPPGPEFTSSFLL